MTALEVFQKLIDELFVLKNFSFTKEEQEDINFVRERIIDGETAENTLCEIECVIAKGNGLI